MKGRFQTLDIITTKQHNKTVTWLMGLQRFMRSPSLEQELTEFCKYLSIRFACGACYADFRGSKVQSML